MEATKRPWRLDYSKPSKDCPVRILGDGEVARIVYRGKFAGDSWGDNARLIVKAVNLHYELVEAISDAYNHCETCRSERMIQRRCARCRTFEALLEKAKGET